MRIATLVEAPDLTMLAELNINLRNIYQRRILLGREMLQALYAVFKTAGANLPQTNTLKSLGDLALAEDDLKQAEEYYDAALPLFEQEQNPIGSGVTRAQRAQIFIALEQPEAAQQAMKQALEIARRFDIPELSDYVSQVA